MTGPNIIIEKWSRAHVSFNEVEGALAPTHGLLGGKYRTFFDDALRASPNGCLYRRTRFLDDLSRGEKVRLGHVTFRLDDIRKSGTVYASGGCLVGSAYCFPFAQASASEFRFHNLGEYIYREETAGHAAAPPDVLMFEVDLAAQPHSSLLGLDYLKLGDIHYNLFADLSYLLSPQELFDLKRLVERRVISALPFLKLCNEAWLSESPLEPDIFFRTLNETVSRLPVLGYLYFEAVSEYLMLFADCAEAAQCLERGEFCNAPYKRLAYGLHPEYKSNFRLTDFNPTLSVLIEYLRNSGFISGFDACHFASYVTHKMVNLVNRLLVSDEGGRQVAANRTWNLEGMAGVLKPLLGHTIHRELRSFKRYHDFYFYYDQMKALQAWNYWNHMGIAVPFNGVFPKGEVGLNPANPELAIRSFRCQVRSGDDGLYAEPIEELHLRFVPRLVDLKYTLMRNKN